MPESLGTTQFYDVYKELYPDNIDLAELVPDTDVFFKMVKKTVGFGGKYMPLPVKYGLGAGRSASYTKSSQDAVAPKYAEFLVTRKRNYSHGYIDNEVVLTSKQNKEAFTSGVEEASGSAIQRSLNDLACHMWRGQSGSIASIDSISTGVITLDNRTDTQFFEVGQTLQANATDGGTPRAAYGYVIRVNRTAGTVTVSDTSISGTAATPSGWTTGDYLLISGDNNEQITGISTWIPDSDPGPSDDLYGVDRSVDPTRLAGIRVDATGKSLDDAFIDALAECNIFGGNPQTLFFHPSNFADYMKSLNTKVTYPNAGGTAKNGFNGVQLPWGNVTAYADRNVPYNRAYMLDMSTWEFKSANQLGQLLPYPDGLGYLRMADEDSSECRAGYYGNMFCRAPGKNAVVILG